MGMLSGADCCYVCNKLVREWKCMVIHEIGRAHV